MVFVMGPVIDSEECLKASSGLIPFNKDVPSRDHYMACHTFSKKQSPLPQFLSNEIATGPGGYAHRLQPPNQDGFKNFTHTDTLLSKLFHVYPRKIYNLKRDINQRQIATNTVDKPCTMGLYRAKIQRNNYGCYSFQMKKNTLHTLYPGPLQARHRTCLMKRRNNVSMMP